ncbi:MAG TPA: hypothetical protein VGM64_04235 [Lacunisphaera sp.]
MNPPEFSIASQATAKREGRLARWLVVPILIGLAVFVLRVALVGSLGTGIPYWDQWDREGLVIYEPWIDGTFSWHAIFAPHLEHHIVWTHLWNLGLLELCGQWDPIVQMVAQAIFPALTAGLAVRVLLDLRMGWVWRTTVIVGALVAFGFPFAYENILWGFQSSFGILVLLSFGVVATASRAWSTGQWWLPLLVGMAAPLAMGAGALAGPLIVGLTLLVIVSERKTSAFNLTMLAGGIACFLWGILLRPEAPVMEFARVKSILSFFSIWVTALAWPNCRIGWLCALACLPIFLLTIQIVRRGVQPRQEELFIIGVGIWAIGCAAGGAWSRGGVEAIPASRYADFLAPLAWSNLLALALVVHHWSTQYNRSSRTMGIVLAAVWIGVAGYGGLRLLDDFFRTERPKLEATAARRFEAVNSVLNGGPVTAMTGVGLDPDPRILSQVMNSPSLASVLPPELQRPPVGITPDKILAAGLPGPHDDWRWLSGKFAVRTRAMVVFVRGDATRLKLALVDEGSGSKNYFAASGRYIGEWAEWLAQTGPGLHRINGEAMAGPGEIAIMMPRPLSLIGYWARWGSAHAAWLIGLAAVCVTLGLVAAEDREKSEA